MLTTEQLSLISDIIGGATPDQAELLNGVVILASREIPIDIESALDTIDILSKQNTDLTRQVSALDLAIETSTQTIVTQGSQIDDLQGIIDGSKPTETLDLGALMRNFDAPDKLRISLFRDGNAYAATAHHERAGRNFLGSGNSLMAALRDLAEKYPNS